MTLFPQSIRWRIQLWHGALLLLVLLFFCGMAWRMKTHDIARNLDRELELRLGAIFGVLGKQAERGGPDPGGDLLGDLFGEDPLGGRPTAEGMGPAQGFHLPKELDSLFSGSQNDAFYFILWSREGPIIGTSNNMDEYLTPPPGGDREQHGAHLRTRNNHREAWQFTPMGECALVGKSMIADQREMAQFGWSLAGIGGTVMVLGLAGGWLLATRAIKPIDDISATALRISAGNLSERINVAGTESELGRLAGVLNVTFERLNTAFEQQARFTSDAAHELRTPVAVILAQTQYALADAGTPAERKEALAACQRAAHRMHNLIQSLLDLAMIKDAAESLDRQPCDLAEVTRDNIDLIRPLAAERKISVQEELTCTPCRANRDSVSQIVTNLLSNAVKFSRTGDNVRVCTHRDNGTAVITISDTGPGIAAEHLPHLFERFYRVDASRNRSTGGAGLGLSICQSIAEAHGGTLTVSSQVGAGSTFTLRIPALD